MHRKFEKVLHDESETVACARSLAGILKVGDVVALSGDLGVGKSVFSRALMRALSVRDEALPSPTYAIIQEYEGCTVDGHACQVAHMDWYRLEGIEDVEMLGVRDFFSPPWITIIEWPERACELLTDAVIRIDLAYVDGDMEKRLLRLSGVALNSEFISS